MKLMICLILMIPSLGFSATYDFTYKVVIPKPDVKSDKLEVWIPLASDTLEQKILQMKIVTPLKYEITTEEKLEIGCCMRKLTQNFRFRLPPKFKPEA